MNKKWLSIVSIVVLLMAQSAFLIAQPYGNSTLKFTGGDKVFNGGFANHSTSTATVELWVKLQNYSGTIVSRMNFSNEVYNGFALEVPNSSQFALSTGRDGSRIYSYITVSVSLNTWVHVAITYNSGTATLYVNGVSKGTSTNGSILNSSYPYSFGSFHPWGDYGLTGGSEIGDIRIFNTVRTASEIASDMASSEPEGALAFWNFAEGVGDTVADASGNGYTGFLGSVNGSSDVNDPTWYEIPNPDPITGIWALAGNNTVTVKWNKSSDPNFARYQIFGGTDQNNLSLLDYSTNVNDTTLLVNSGLTNGTLYYFSVRQKNTSNQFSEFDEYDAAVPAVSAGNAIELNADFGQYVEIQSNNAPLGDHAYTIEAWINPSTMGTMGILGYGEYNVQNNVNAFRLGEGGLLINYWWGNDLTVNVGDISGSWHHVAVTYDGEFRKMYLDGVLVGSDQPVGMNIPYASNLTIGRTFYAEHFDGELDEVRLWNIARSESEISDNMNTPLRGDESGLVLLFHFDEPTGDIAYDASLYKSDGNWINEPSVSVSGAMGETLPVELSSFTAQSNNGTVQLNWSTVSESNNAGWEVEVRRFDAAQRDENSYSQKNKNASVTLSPSADGSKGFTKIGFVSGKGTTTEKQSYEFQIESSQFNASSLQFRLKQIDFDGKFSYSNILTVNLTPNSFGLTQNYPNPFNPVTVINYQLQSQSDVKLVVFDMLGREVATLVNEKKETGSYSATFNGENLTSGIYFYKLTAGNFSETRKMTLVK